MNTFFRGVSVCNLCFLSTVIPNIHSALVALRIAKDRKVSSGIWREILCHFGLCDRFSSKISGFAGPPHDGMSRNCEHLGIGNGRTDPAFSIRTCFVSPLLDPFDMQYSPESLTGNGVSPSPFAVHTDLYSRCRPCCDKRTG